MKNATILIFCILMQTISARAVTYNIGPTQTYSSPNSLYVANVLEDGDTILINMADYVGTEALAVWQNNDLVILGTGGRPHLIADGEYIWGKGIWVLAGNNITVENIEFSDAAVPDQNGAGIRLDGIGLTVRHCYFHDNQMGILTNNSNEGHVFIEYSEFENNSAGDGFSHNVYVGHIDKLTFQFNYSHHTEVGHNLKSRANDNRILYNRIMDEETGGSSRLIDIPNGGFSIIMGNLLMQGENAPNQNMVGYGLEGLANPSPHELYFINNTLVNKRNGCTFIHVEQGTEGLNLSNNIFAGNGIVLLFGTISDLVNANNLIEEDIEAFHFTDEANYNYQILASSPARDYGTTVDSIYSISLTPESHYSHPTNSQNRLLFDSVIDAGAYEFFPALNTVQVLSSEISVFPNPTEGIVTVDALNKNVKELLVYNQIGEVVYRTVYAGEIDLSSFGNGLYFLKAVFRNNESVVRAILKEGI